MNDFLEGYDELIAFLFNKYPELISDNYFVNKYLNIRNKHLNLQDEMKSLRRQIILAGVETSLTKRDNIVK